MDLTSALATVGLVIGGGGGLYAIISTILSKKLRTPADKVAAEQAANDLILKLLDRANAEIEHYESLIDKLTDGRTSRRAATDELVEDLHQQLGRVTVERDRLALAIAHLRVKARKNGHLTYAEIVIWASNALDPSVPLDDVDAEDVDAEDEATRIPVRT